MFSNVEGVPLGPAHALTGKAGEGRDALRRRLRIGRVHDLVARGIQPQRQLPVLREAPAPAEGPQQIGTDHVCGAGDHFQRAERFLEGTLHHVRAGVFGAHGLRQPALRLVEHVPLVALHGGDFRAAVHAARPPVTVSVLIEVGE